MAQATPPAAHHPFAMPPTCTDPDPYAELDYRADAGELSEEFRKPTRIRILPRRAAPGSRHPATGIRRGV